MITKEKISVILPTCNRYPVCRENVENVLRQDYPNFEVIVCDDSDLDYNKANAAGFLEFVRAEPRVKYLYTARFDRDGKKDYGLARARNFGIIQSTGEYLVFLDDRMTPDNPNVLKLFAQWLSKGDKVWYFGDKGAQKTSFVENFSAICRHRVIDAGMFCERIDKYGAMTRELHGRFSRQGFTFKYLPEVVGRQVCKSTGWDKKDKEIPEMRKFLEHLFSR